MACYRKSRGLKVADGDGDDPEEGEPVLKVKERENGRRR